MPSPVGRVHVDHHIFMPGYDVYVPHAVKPAPYGAHTQRIFFRQLPQCQLVVYIIGYYQLSAWAVAANKLTAAIQAFIQLAILAQTILFDVRRLTPFTLFYS